MGRVFQRKKKQKNGTVKVLPTWWIRYRQGGRAKDESSGSIRKSDAVRLLKLREADVVKGVLLDPRVRRLRFEDAAKNLLNEYDANNRRSKVDVKRRITKHLAPHFGGYRMNMIRTPMIRTYTTARLDAGAARGTVNRELSVLKRMFSIAVKDGVLAERPYIPMLEEDNVRTGFFEAAEVRAVLDHLPPSIQPVITFAYLTGWRVRSEVLTLQWHQIDFDSGNVRLEPGTTKSRKARTFPFSVLPELRDLMLTQREQTQQLERRTGQIVPWVFHRNGKPFKTFYRAWRTACEKAGCPGRIPHDLRRSAVRNLVRAGVSDKVAMQLTGHKTRSVFDRYDIVSQTDLREGVAKLAEQSPGTVPCVTSR